MNSGSTVLSRIRELDAKKYLPDYLGLVICGQCVGNVKKNLVPTLLECVSPFSGPVFKKVAFGGGEALELVPETHPTEEERTHAMAVAAKTLGKKIKNEQYGLGLQLNGPMCTVDRGVAAHFGGISPGVHLLCYVRDQSTLGVWAAKRAENKASYPSFFDPTVAGGTPSTISLQANMEKEADEEASIPKHLSQTARPAGLLH